jgi:Icc-related predicted phosphoesterase
MLHICGHIPECKGVVAAKTIFINTGSIGRDEEVVEISVAPEGVGVIYRKV